MFEDILEKDTKPNRKIVCRTCDTVIITIETEFDGKEFEIEKWEYECKQCEDKTIHCVGGCGKTSKLASKEQVKTTRWTCLECCDIRRNQYD